ncbi:MAG: hypothetical protein U5L75_00470 [Candidatus Campbellbacteria bacterium]|nr:hypothetical protein [Candidatus Campbellbacteria bacterium]
MPSHSFELVEVDDNNDRFLSAREIRNIFEKKRKEIGLEGWRVVIDYINSTSSITVTA